MVDTLNTLLGVAGAANTRLFSTIFIMAAWLGIIYVIMVLPNKKKNKKHKEMLDALKVGDTVITIGGIKGEVMGIQEEYLELKLDQKGNRITLKKSAVSQVIK